MISQIRTLENCPGP